MIVAGTVVTVLYGDDLPARRAIGEVRPLEMLMTEAGLEMERQALEGRVKSFERNRRRQEFMRALQMGQEGGPAAAGVPPLAGRGRPR
jgi:RecJ-like exonuclease